MIYEFGPFRLDAAQQLLTQGGAPSALGPKAVETLLALVENAGQIVSKDHLIARVWPEGFIDDASLSQNIYLLRKQLRAAWDADPIETLPRRGYRFTAPVTLIERPGPNIRRAVSWRTWVTRGVVLLLCLGLSIVSLYFLRGRPAQPEALDQGSKKIYDLGAFYSDQRTMPAETRAVDLFKEVVARQPSSPQGYLGLATAYALRADYCMPRLVCDAAADSRLAKGMLAKTFAHAPDLSQAHALAGIIASDLDHDYAVARREYQRAIALDPGNSLAHHWFGTMLFQHRDFEAARDQFETAARQDPASSVITAWLARDYYFLRRYDAAISFAHQSLELNPQRIDALAVLGLAYARTGRPSQAIPPFARLSAAGFPQKARVLRAYADGLRGDTRGAQQALRGLAPTPNGERDTLGPVLENYRYVDEMDLAAALFALGDRTGALRRLHGIRSSVSEAKAWVRADPRFDSPRSDPALQAWLTKML